MDLRYLERFGWAGALALAGVLALSPGVEATEPTRAELEERIRRLERIIEQRGLDRPAGAQPTGAVPAAEPAAPPLEQSTVEAIVDEKLRKQKVLAGWKDGFFLESASGDFKLKLRGYTQVDFRNFPVNGGQTNSDSIFLRRVRPILEGTVYKYFGFRIMPDFGGGSTTLQDAYIDVNYFAPWAKLRGGKFKPPLSLERLQSATDILFIERSLANNLAPSRDIGFQLSGDVYDGLLTWQAEYANGSVDGGLNDGDTSSDKEGIGRLFGHPFKPLGVPALANLGLGVAGSYGYPEQGDNEEGDNVGTQLRYRTTGRATWFRYASSSTVNILADGRRWRIIPQAYWYWGPFGFMAEYLLSSQQLKRVDTKAETETYGEFTNSGWFAQASWVLTGEDNSFTGITPINPFDPWNGRWGAFELGARGGWVDIDDATFEEGFATLGQSASKATQYGVAVNWWLNRAVRISLDYEHTNFDVPVLFGSEDRRYEDVLLLQLQLGF